MAPHRFDDEGPRPLPAHELAAIGLVMLLALSLAGNALLAALLSDARAHTAEVAP